MPTALLKHSHLRALYIATILFAALLVLSGCGATRAPQPQPVRSCNACPIVDTAKSVVGIPYKWGGQQPQKGFDCSGLIWWVYKRHGIDLPRPSWEQINAGVQVPYSERTYGDLIFFNTEGKGFHVGIISGQYTFIHSPSKGKTVRETQMSNYWSKRFIAVKRIVR
ncbi:MAG: C40 family peptidase [Desulfovibrio sp.]